MTIDEMFEKVCNEKDSPQDKLFDLLYQENYIKAINVIKDYLKCDENTAKIICMDFKTKVYDDIFSSDLPQQEQEYNNAIAQEWLNKPKCPTCGSTNIKKISGISKAGSVAMLGIFSQKIKKQMHCNNCGYEW